ncbi:MAG TPA: hypothetical protein VLL05_22360 [Terriglobales bacterium]|nr:hypothetical protein [Terriglobales bacterium]
MKTFARLTLSATTAGILCFLTGWLFPVHYGQTVGLTEANMNSVIWTTVAIGLVMASLLSWTFYKAVQ